VNDVALPAGAERFARARHFGLARRDDVAAGAGIDSLLIWHGDLPATPPPQLVEGILPETGVAFFAGQSQFAKTFGGADLAVSVMTGSEFAGHAVLRTGGVLWLAAEGETEIDARIRAVVLGKLEPEWRDKRLPFARQAQNVPSLTDKDALPKLRALVAAMKEGLKAKHNSLPLALIVIDTLGAAAGFSDENSASETQKVANMLRELSRETGALVLVIDHYGKIAETGIRGSSAKKAAADVVLAFLGKQDEAGNITERRMAITKMRAGLSGLCIPFELKPVRLDDGTTTCMVEWQEAAEPNQLASKRGKWSGNAIFLKKAIETVVVQSGKPMRPFGTEGPQVMAVEFEEVRAEFMKSFAADKQDTKLKAFNRSLAAARKSNLVASREMNGADWLWLATREG
jgi:hypothetical protein